MASDWEILEVVGTEEDAEVIAGYLESQGMPCQIESAHSHEFPVNVTALGNVRIEVPAGRLEEARQLLADRESLGADEQPEGSGEEGV
jgi:hypothetical protein